MDSRVQQPMMLPRFSALSRISSIPSIKLFASFWLAKCSLLLFVLSFIVLNHNQRIGQYMQVLCNPLGYMPHSNQIGIRGIEQVSYLAILIISVNLSHPCSVRVGYSYCKFRAMNLPSLYSCYLISYSSEISYSQSQIHYFHYCVSLTLNRNVRDKVIFISI